MTPKEIAAAAVAVLVVIIAAAARRWLRTSRGYEWCGRCGVWCHEADDPCECCEYELDDDDQADEAELAERIAAAAAAPFLWLVRVVERRRGASDRIGAYDDGEPVTGELYGPQDNPWRIRPYLPVELHGREPYCGDPTCTSLQCWEAGPRELDADEAWSRELADINRARHTGELDELSLEHTDTRRLYVDLTDDPDLLEWDAKQQAGRAWQIVYVQFPALRAELTRDYAAAAAESRRFWRAA